MIMIIVPSIDVLEFLLPINSRFVFAINGRSLFSMMSTIRLLLHTLKHSGMSIHNSTVGGRDAMFNCGLSMKREICLNKRNLIVSYHDLLFESSSLSIIVHDC